MSTLTLSYQDFAALCEEILGSDDVLQRPPRSFGGRAMRLRFRGRWYLAAGGLVEAGRPGLRRRHGFPRSRR
jgi:hypothetical protein